MLPKTPETSTLSGNYSLATVFSRAAARTESQGGLGLLGT